MPKIKALSTILTATLLLAGIVVTVLAAEAELTQTWSWQLGGEDELVLTSTVRGTPAPPSGWPNVAIPEGEFHTYRVMTNFWNEDAAIKGTNLDEVTMEMTVEDETGAFWITSSPDSYYPDGREGPCAYGDPGCNWTPNNERAPAAYPAIYKGCHWGECSESEGTLFPLRISEVASLFSRWEWDLGAAGTEPDAAFSVAYKMWLDRNASGALPDHPEDVDQNDGAEIAIWINNRGYDKVNNTGDPIRPSGELVADGATIPSVPGTWDVWIEPDAGDDVHWHTVSYVREDRVTEMDVDGKLFLRDAMARSCGDEMCVLPSWWLTSMQAGFEIWSNGEGLRSDSFVVSPATVTGEFTGQDQTSDGRPIIYWTEPITIETAGCADGTAEFTLTPDEGNIIAGDMRETSWKSGVYVVDQLGPFKSSYGDSTLEVSIECPDGSNLNQSGLVFLDPNGPFKVFLPLALRNH